VTDLAWIDAALTSARPQALGALLRYFRDLDTAEEAYQNACLRALKTWPQNGPPRDAAAWLILVGRNSGIDDARRRNKQQALPPDDEISDTDDAESALAERLDGSHYRDDILRLLFVCCHPDLPATQQIALALRIVSGLSVKQIARAFLVSEAAMEQRITRAKAAVAKAGVPFETPGAVERSERLAAVAAMIYLMFNEGYSASGEAIAPRAPRCEEAIRLARLLLRLFQTEPEIMGLTALLLLQHARAAATSSRNCRRKMPSPTPTTQRVRSPSGSTARIIATIFCGCCSSAAIRSCRRRSRSRWRCASSPASR
jgi:RNA polymerase sigma-70 factor (ECF subfamily)